MASLHHADSAVKTPRTPTPSTNGRATAEQVNAITIGPDGKPDISQLVSASKPQTLLQRWNVRSLKNAYAERQPTQYVIDRLLPLPSLSVVYGSPGSMKSMLLADAAVSVASGQPWLTGLPTEEGQIVKAFRTMQAAVLWIDYDNGTLRTDERFDALATARGLPEDAPIHYVSMAQPWFDATDGYLVRELVEAVRELNAKLVVIDNLGLISGDSDENSADMVKVMGNLRRMAEDSGAAIVVIHHQRKGSTADRAGDLLRGHSSIEAALDLALLVTRDGQEPKLTISPTKVRGASIAASFGAEFTYEHSPNTHDLAAAKFWGRSILSAKEIEKEEISAASLIVLNRMANSGAPVTQKELVETIMSYIDTNLDIKKPGRDKVRRVLDEMETDGRIKVSLGDKNAKIYRI